jgi:hypothetical protein
MKKLPATLALAAAVLAAGAGTARAEGDSDRRIGVKAGVNGSSAFGPGTPDLGWALGATAGGMALFPLDNITDGLFFQPELLLTMKGFTQTNGDNSANVRLNYVEAPLLMKYMFSSVGDAEMKPSVFGGVALSFLFSSSATFSDGKTEPVDGVAGFDAGVVIGGGLDFSAADMGPFHADARCELGLAGVAKSSANTHNLAFTLSIGYTWDL